MLQHRPRTTGAMVEILPRKRSERAARKVAYGKFRAQPDLSAGILQADIQFGILIVGETFIISADGKKCAAVEGCMVTMIDIAGTCSGSMSGSAIPQPAVLCSSYPPLQKAAPARSHWDDDRRYVALLQFFDEADDEIGRVPRMKSARMMMPESNFAIFAPRLTAAD